ncbi:MAG: hypothetical protein E7561_01550 [Ruminococcaceae bacterium]|nr:hypothetical protein [Oscillospiraceae bacterium]
MNKNFNSKNLEVVDFLTKETFYDRELWAKFVNQFRFRDDNTNLGWRGEYWGKSMRGAAMICSYSNDEKLYEILTETVRDMLTTQDEYGRFASYDIEKEYHDWDVWCRKYVLLGFLYYYDICKDDALKKEIIEALCKHADYILSTVGDDEGKLKINETSHVHYGMNSSSILEPIVKLYNITKEQKYFDFATHIVNCGGARKINIFELAYKNELAPYEYGITKAYELMSCFEGLCEYYYVTGEEKYKTAAINFGKRLIETDVTVIGCSGTTHELLDFSAMRQTVPYDNGQQETCVTVTWMKLCDKLYKLSGEAIFAEEIERSYYNAYLGAVNDQKKVSNDRCFISYSSLCGIKEAVPSFLPFDSYSPLLVGKRGIKTGGAQMLRDGTYFGCCACIAGAGVGSFINSSVVKNESTVIINQFINGKVSDENFNINITTDYPKNETVNFVFDTKKDTIIKVRIPSWSKDTKIKADFDYQINDGYLVANLNVGKYNLKIDFDFSVYATYPKKWSETTIYTEIKIPEFEYVGTKIKYSPEQDNYVCLTRGPLVLGADSRLDKDINSVFSPLIKDGKAISVDSNKANFPVDVCQEITAEDGTTFTLVDYKSCGRDWESYICAWLKTK